MGHIKKFRDMVGASKLLAPNIKTMTLKLFTGNAHTGNEVAREVVRNHLLGLRWMNPNAVVYLREERGQGTPVVEYELWTSPGVTRSMEIKGSLDAQEVVAKVLMAGRDPADDAGAVEPGVGAAAGKGAVGGELR